MKSFLFPALTALLLQAGLAQAIPAASNSNPPRSCAQTLVFEKAKQLLLKSVHFGNNGEATSYFGRNGRDVRVEWRNLVFRQLIFGTVSPKDHQRGITRRVYAQLSSDAYRLIDSDGEGEWLSGHCPGFPGFIMAEEINGEFVVSSPDLDQFRISPKTPAQPHPQQVGDERVVASRF